MIYPSNFEAKIGFDHIRQLLRHHCASNLGEEWVNKHLTFSSDYTIVIKNLREGAEFQRFELEETGCYEPHFFDCREALLHARPERTYIEEHGLFDLRRSLETIGRLVKAFQQVEDGGEAPKESEEQLRYPALYEMSQGASCFPEIVQRIDSILDKYGRIKDHASPELASIRKEKHQVERSISGSLRSILASAQKEGLVAADVSPTMRDGRLVIPVAPALKRKISGIVHDESTSGKTVFIEPTVVVEANNRVRELENAEKREVIRILQETTSMIRPHIGEIMESFVFLAHIDFLRAANQVATAMEARVPKVIPKPHLEMEQAVHPLLERSLQKQGRTMNRLDICLGKGKGILIISGPNAGGKSICLKTTGLLQYMLQCGLPIPVGEGSVMGIFESIFIDIGDEQSLENDLSTYSSHLLNMKAMMAGCSLRSLLLIDEFGGGTDPMIGGALAEAILQRFIKKQSFGIITTHYQNLKRVAEHFPSVVNGAMLYDRGEMRPLFRLQIGSPGSSFAVDIARKIGIPNDVIQQASDIVGKDYILSDKYLQDIVRDKIYWERKRESIHKREKQLEEKISFYEAEIRKLSSERKEILHRARSSAEAILQQSNAQIENTIRAIKESQAEKQRTLQVRQELETFKEQATQALADDDDKIAKKMAKLQRYQQRKKEGKSGGVAQPAKQTTSNADLNTLTPLSTEQPINIGDNVRIKGQSNVGKVEAIKGKQARVLFGMLYTNVDIERLQHADAPIKNKSMQESTFVSKETRDAFYKKKLDFQPQIDIRGMRADEALTAISYYMDDALSVAYPQVRILHGTGTGALRDIVRNYLSSLKGIRRFHDEHVQFGGSGITVVEI